MKKIAIFLMTLALMLTPILCFAETPATSDAVTTAADTTAAVTEAVTTEAESFMFSPYNFIDNLEYMLSGMIGIFVVIGLIVIVTIVLNKIMSRKKGE